MCISAFPASLRGTTIVQALRVTNASTEAAMLAQLDAVSPAVTPVVTPLLCAPEAGSGAAGVASDAPLAGGLDAAEVDAAATRTVERFGLNPEQVWVHRCSALPHAAHPLRLP